MEDSIKVYIENADDAFTELEIPLGIELSLMEVLKGEGYPIEATCDGMALCATCHIEVLEGFDKLHEESDEELDMLDSLPNLCDTSRLSCQLKIQPELDGLKIRIKGDADA
ncbi:MAG: 2Fe-2S iron-sulfur cluster-binding protein [Chitinophagales bacterium]